MRPLEFQASEDLNAAPSEVWAHLVDWERLDRWMSEASDFRVTSSQREGVGVEARATIRIAGIRSVDRIRVSRWDPPHTLEITHLGWVKGTGLMRCFAAGNGTHLLWLESLVPPLGILGRAGMLVLRRKMGRTFQNDLRRLKQIVEGEADGRAGDGG